MILLTAATRTLSAISRKVPSSSGKDSLDSSVDDDSLIEALMVENQLIPPVTSGCGLNSTVASHTDEALLKTESSYLKPEDSFPNNSVPVLNHPTDTFPCIPVPVLNHPKEDSFPNNSVPVLNHPTDTLPCIPVPLLNHPKEDSFLNNSIPVLNHPTDTLPCIPVPLLNHPKEDSFPNDPVLSHPTDSFSNHSLSVVKDMEKFSDKCSQDTNEECATSPTHSLEETIQIVTETVKRLDNKWVWLHVINCL